MVYMKDFATSTTASSDTLPNNLVLTSIENLDDTNTIEVSFKEAIDTNNDEKVTLGTESSISFANINKSAYVQTNTVYHDANAGAPTLRIIGVIVP